MRWHSFALALIGQALLLSSAALGADLKILSLNIQQFPYGISPHNEERSDRLLATIEAHHDEFDVIAFQELWSILSREKISQALITHYPFQFVDEQCGAFVLGCNSGLAIFSKYPIKETFQYTYRHFRDVENFAKKGLLAAVVQLGATSSALVVDTHMQAPDTNIPCPLPYCGPDFEQTIIGQLGEANTAITAWRHQHPTSATFFVGDFNIVAHSPLYETALGMIGEAADTHDGNDETLDPASSVWEHHSNEGRIDYIWTIGGGAAGHSRVVDYFGPDTTDHLGVVGQYTVDH